MRQDSPVASQNRVGVGVVGLGFGAQFAPIYLAHPDVDFVAICDPNEKRLTETGDRHDIRDRYRTLEELLGDPRVEAIHLLTPVGFHVEQTLAVLGSGRHCACAVPMATDLEGLRRIVAAAKASGKNYMMMETGVYTREFLYAQEILQRGELGNLTFLRGLYCQDLEGAYARYWRSMAPMLYATHSIGPILSLAGTRASKVSCFGSGHLRSDVQQPGGTTFPLQTGIFRLSGTDLAFEVTRSWFQTARGYTEAFSVYGDRRGFEWQQLEHEDPVVFTMRTLEQGMWGRDAQGERVAVPFRPDLLPAELRPFAEGGHGGSHPHLVHEFISSIVEGRPSRIDPVTAADWCAAGICADLSSRMDGEMVEIPGFN